MNRLAIYLSINPSAAMKIEKGLKTCEFRNYVPKRDIKYLFVYVTSPVCKLKYIIEIDNIVKYPSQVDFNGDGNEEFNKGLKSRYAFQIKKVSKLVKELSLGELRQQYSFSPPQSFSYCETYNLLTRHIENADKILVQEYSR